jgi:glycosyltransferase involved in cell wall biosynthesis
LRTFNDGIGELSLQLGQGLARLAPELREQHGLELFFHLPQRLHGHFGANVHYLPTGDLQRMVHLCRHRFDVWHSLHQFNPFKPPLGSRAIVQTILDLNFMHVGNARKQRKYLRRMRALARRSAALVTISDFVRGDLQRHLGLGTPVHVIPLAARDLSGAPQQAVADLARQKYLLHISRMAPSKNVLALLDMAAAWPEMGLVLAGARSPYSLEIAAQVRARGLDNVRVLHDVSDAQKAWLLTHCEAFVFPSLTEGFGLPPLEAMHFGKPVFLSHLTSLPEVGGDAAHYWDGFDPLRMKQQLIDAMASFGPDAANRTRERAASFSWQRCTERHVQLYRSLLPPSSDATR